VFHKLLDILNEHLGERQLESELRNFSSRTNDARWRAAFTGALIELVQGAKEWDGVTDELKKWQGVCQKLFGGMKEYSLILKMLGVLIQFKEENYRALLSLPLEERRLLVSEAEEVTLLSARPQRASKGLDD
jgi:hypothetical protein